MFLSRLDRPNKKGRLRAVFLCVTVMSGTTLLLGGCAADKGDHPLLSTVRAFLPGGRDVSQNAKDISYASIEFSISRRSGLLVLAEQRPNLTFWQSSQAETIVLQRGYLQSTAGLQSNLMMTQLSGLPGRADDETAAWRSALESPIDYKVLRSWRVEDGKLQVDSAQATMTCRPGTEKTQLPLAILPLRRCDEVLHWGSGATTHSSYWIDQKDGRIWAADTKPWPGAERYGWRVARPWW